MVRAPCCEKTSVKKGPWSHQEDQILMDYINLHGHPNWRILPKLAGLSRCGKSCRLRWTNYLRPDIKRGNFSKEEEETIMQLHTKMGNRWSAIAARLPGRTDNEIKNVWHTHLKKIVNPNPDRNDVKKDCGLSPLQTISSGQPSYNRIDSPQPSCTDVSSVTTSIDDNLFMKDVVLKNFPEMDDEFWLDVFSGENSDDLTAVHENIAYESNLHGDMDFWFNNVFTKAGEYSPKI